MKKTIRDYEYEGKVVILRCDFNVPIEDGRITDTTRISKSLDSIKYLIERNAKIVILSHFGKVASKEDKLKYTLYSVYLELSHLLDTRVMFSSYSRGGSLQKMVEQMENKQVLLVENTRFEDYPDKLESSCDMDLAKEWASLGDIFIDDAYGCCHRCHASNVGIAKFLPSGIGFLMEQEINNLDHILNAKTHPFVVIMGGKKVEDKLPMITNLINRCDKILVGGGMCFTFLKAMGIDVGDSIVDNNNLERCRGLLEKHGDKIVLPVDIMTSNKELKDIENITRGDVGYDIGDKTITKYLELLKDSKRVVMNGPMGVFEDDNFIKGTYAIYEFLANKKISCLIGGGDTLAAFHRTKIMGDNFYISTGGGATLKYLSGESLPALEVISDKD